MYRIKDQNGKIKYSGRSKAVVIDNRDPLDSGKIRIDHPLLGETVWIEYLHEPGNFSVPSIGDVVYVECDAGNPEFPICWGNLTKGNAEELPATFKRDIPTNRGMYTPNGHLFEMDDGEATLGSNPDDKNFTTKNRGIRFTSKAGNIIHITEDSDNGVEEIVVKDVKGNELKFDYKNQKVIIIAQKDQEQTIAGDWTVTVNGNTVLASADIKLDTAKTTMTGTAQVDGNLDAKANVDVTGDLSVTGNSDLGGAIPLLLATAQFIGVGNLGAPVISSVMTGQTTKSTSS